MQGVGEAMLCCLPGLSFGECTVTYSHTYLGPQVNLQRCFAFVLILVPAIDVVLGSAAPYTVSRVFLTWSAAHLVEPLSVCAERKRIQVALRRLL